MFNGIVYNLGVVKALKRSARYVKGSLVIEISSNIKFKKEDIGESVCCDGVCLTLIRIKKKSFLKMIFIPVKIKVNETKYETKPID